MTVKEQTRHMSGARRAGVAAGVTREWTERAVMVGVGSASGEGASVRKHTTIIEECDPLRTGARVRILKPNSDRSERIGTVLRRDAEYGYEVRWDSLNCTGLYFADELEIVT